MRTNLDADPRAQNLVRVVHLVFHDVPEGHSITIGKVEVFGYVATPPVSPHDSWVQYKQSQADHYVCVCVCVCVCVSVNQPLEWRY
jgi:hypothetical protein